MKSRGKIWGRVAGRMGKDDAEDGRNCLLDTYLWNGYEWKCINIKYMHIYIIHIYPFKQHVYMLMIC